jgi:hypothetical protein
MVAIALFVRAREGRVVRRVLPAYVTAGWLTPPEVGWLATLTSRRSARQWARAVGGEPGDRAMQEYQFSATKLAMLRERQLRGHVDPDFVARERELLAALTRAREFFRAYSPYGPVPPPPPALYR